MSAAEAGLVVLLALLAWYALPAAVVGGFASEMESRGEGAINHRGRTVFLGLGVAWPVAAFSAWVVGSLAPAWQPARWLSSMTVGSMAAATVPFVLGAFALGLLDDAYGSSADRGLAGHAAALAEGRLTTGMLKAIGISGLALMAGVSVVAADAPMGALEKVWPGAVPHALLAAATVALTANLVNLLDLRPARALKSYTLLAAPFAALLGARAATAASPEDPLALAVGAAALLVFALGPVAAVWRYDAGERGMLGDAGANAAGMLAGMLAALALPMPALAGWAAVLLGLNLLSEVVSFSALIERNALLRWLDRLGRARSEES